MISDDVLRSRAVVSRRRALSLGGTIGLGSLLAACGRGTDGGAGTAAATPSASASATPSPSVSTTAITAASGDVLTALDAARTCAASPEQTQGPYWFDVDSLRSDITEGRPGTPLQLALRVQDVSACATGGAATPVASSVVEIWHCDAGGLYSGFESGSTGGPGGAPPARPETPEVSDGSYASGDQEATTTDDGTYLRGAQVADANGVVQFATVFPGWYRGRTTHIHLKVHLDRETVLTSQVYVDDAVAGEVYATAPYNTRTGRDTFNADDRIFSEEGLLAVERIGSGYRGVLNIGVNV
jgi:protocatechuate 3,4-dioxygenase beta subunit